MLAGCGTGVLQHSQNFAPQAPQSTTVQLRIGDAPADQVFAFEVTIASPINLIPQSGGPAAAITVDPNRLELTRTAGKMQPISVMALQPGSYSAAEITIQHPSLTYAKTLLMPNPVTLIDSVDGADQTVRINFNPPLVVGTDPVVLNLDVDLASALVSGSGGSILGTHFTESSFKIGVQPVGIAGHQQDDDGEFESVTGRAVEVTTGGFVLQTGQTGSRLPFTVDGSTVFPSGLGLADLQNRLIEIQGFTRSDGTLYTKDIEMLGDQSASQIEGTLTTIGFNAPTLMEFIAQDGAGTGFTSAQVGQDFLTDISAVPSASFIADFGDCDEAALPAPAANFPFDAAHLKGGQRVEIITESGVRQSQPIIASQVRLQQQAISGTVSNFATLPGGASNFDLQLPADSYVTLLSGQTTVHVIGQSGTDNRAGSFGNGDAVRVRGPLFWTGTQFNMVARRITE
ncbi:MAG TPA: hypothetical protein VKH81_23370 [Candidatus Angelobacter sp.]|nr:hypothetical protein [Candidatus Angelobacter sp.]